MNVHMKEDVDHRKTSPISDAKSLGNHKENMKIAHKESWPCLGRFYWRGVCALRWTNDGILLKSDLGSNEEGRKRKWGEEVLANIFCLVAWKALYQTELNS